MKDDTQKFIVETILHSVILIIFEVILLAIIIPNPASFIYGLLFGYAFCLIFFSLMYLNISRALDMTETGAKRYMFANYMARYFLTACILLISAMYPFLSIYTCFLGLLTIKIVLYIKNLINYIKGNKTPLI